VFGGNTFFGTLKYEPDESYGCALQSIAIKSGHGRVAVWTDSTLFSNFSMCMSGVPDLALGYVNWLNRSNRVDSRVTSWGWSAWAVCLIGLILSSPIGQTLAVWAIAIPAICCMVPFVDAVNIAAYRPADITRGFKIVGFDQQYSQLELPTHNHVHDEDPDVFESFFVMTQRRHLMPVAAQSVSHLRGAAVIVFCNPHSEIPANDVTLVREQLDTGANLCSLYHGKLLKRTPALDNFNKLLFNLNAKARFSPLPKAKRSEIIGSLLGDSILTNVEAWATIQLDDSNSERLVQTSEGDIVVAAEQFGKGKIILCSVADLFSNLTIGAPGKAPEGEEALIVDFALRLIDEAAGRGEPFHASEKAWDEFLKKTKPSLER
jgi:hypothetical protein